jgi:O-antigen ligase
VPGGFAVRVRRPELRSTLLMGALLCALAVQGAAITRSYVLAAPLLCALVVALATDIPLIPLVTTTFVIRVLTGAAISTPTAQHSGSLNISGAIAVLFILVAVGLLARRRRGLVPAVLAGLWLGVSTGVAIKSQGTSTETLREGVREASILALAVIVCNARGAFSVPLAVRVVQVAGLGSALLAIYQFATHTGLNVEGAIRSNGTFTHPNGAAMYFGLATTASLWRYLDHGRRRSDALFAALFAAATITTFSLGGLASLLVMLMTLGALRPGSMRLKLGSFAIAGLIMLAFLATPLGAKRFANEASTHLSTTQTRVGVNTSFAWRIYKWRTLIPEWERDPLLGRGLGTTVTAEGTSENTTAGKQPHDEYVRYLVETGAVGLVLLLAGIGWLLARLKSIRRHPETRDVATLGIAIVVGCLLNALGDNTLLYSTTGYAVALILAAILSAPPVASSQATRMRSA